MEEPLSRCTTCRVLVVSCHAYTDYCSVYDKLAFELLEDAQQRGGWMNAPNLVALVGGHHAHGVAAKLRVGRLTLPRRERDAAAGGRRATLS